MKIMILTQVLPYPPDSGPKVKTLNVIKYLSGRYELTLVSFTRGDQSKDVRHLQEYCKAVYTVPIQRGAALDAWYLLQSFLTGQPFMMRRDDRAAMRQLVDRLASEEQFDVAQADQLNMAQYARRVKGARWVLDAHNALWLLYKRLWQTMDPGPKKWLLNRDWRMLKTYEGHICKEFDAVLAVSDEDRVALEEAANGPLNLAVIPIAVDTDQITPVERKPGAGHLIHVGTMYWPPNIDGILWFIHEILPLVREHHPEVIFDVVGANPPAEIVASDKKDGRINVTGYVPDPTPYLEQAAMMVVPLRAGGGMRVKILNALAQGLPVVTTTLGCEGIAVEHGKHLFVADTSQDFARSVICLLEDQALAGQLGRNGRELILSKYDYRVTGAMLDQVYQKKLG